MRVMRGAAILLATCVVGCSTMQDPEKMALAKELALDEPPYFPKCVATESGTFRQREIDRHMWWPVEFQGDVATPITDKCVRTQP
jgi:hypothetical protein